MRVQTDADSEEDGIIGELGGFLETLRSRGAQCPEPSLLTAANAGVLPDHHAAGVAAHLTDCMLCQALARDMADPELTAPTDAERARMQSRVLGDTAGAGKVHRPAWTSWLWGWQPLVAAATLVVALAAVGWWFSADRQAPQRVRPQVQVPPEAQAPTGAAPDAAREAAPSQPTTTQQLAAVLPLEKPAVTVPLGDALLWRSQSRAGQDKFMEDLGNALAPYRENDFAEAARRLDILVRTRPTPEVQFYLGVCRLFLGQNDLAVGDLLQARQKAQAAVRQDAAWYLAVAYQRVGQLESALAELRTLCGEKGEHQVRACDALTVLQSPGR